MMGQAQEIYGSVPDPRLHKRLAQRLYDVCPQVRQDIQTDETTFKSLKSPQQGRGRAYASSLFISTCLTA